MGFTRAVAVVVASVFMMLICHSESTTTSALDISNVTNCQLVNLLKGWQCKCVPIDSCCEERPPNPTCPDPEDLINCVDERITVDVGARQNSTCPDLLTVCCCDVCPPPSPPPETKQCGIRNANGVRITVTGFTDKQAQFGEFPWMVAVLKQGSHEYVGGASLVHPRVVLTAAHKVYDKTQNVSLAARIGDWNLDSAAAPELIAPQEIKVEKVLVHPDFNRKKYENNVALLILEKDAILSESVMPICLPLSGQVFDGSDCYVTGWGKNVFGDEGRYQKIMKKVSVPAVNHNECQRMLRNTRLGSRFKLHSTLNCAGGLGEDACEGDGGSPLVCPNPNPNCPTQYVQMGVVAFGIGCGQIGHPGVYGSIPQTVDWIVQAIVEEIGLDAFVDERGLC